MQYTKNEKGLYVPDALAAGKYLVQHLRNEKVIDEFEAENVIVNEGLNYMINAGLGGGSIISVWYLGLFSGNYSPTSTDAAATIAANATETTAYTAGARQQFQPASASGQSITNSASRASFTFNATVAVYGAFLISSATIGGTSGTLFSAAQFGTLKNVTSGDQMLLTYTFSLASN